MFPTRGRILKKAESLPAFLVTFVSFCSKTGLTTILPRLTDSPLSFRGKAIEVHRIMRPGMLSNPLGVLFNFHEVKLVDGLSRLILRGAKKKP
jgi:hypothetical protein